MTRSQFCKTLHAYVIANVLFLSVFTCCQKLYVEAKPHHSDVLRLKFCSFTESESATLTRTVKLQLLMRGRVTSKLYRFCIEQER